MEEQAPQQEIREGIIQSLQFAENIIAGNYASEVPSEESLDPAEVFVGPILDLNDETLNEREIAEVEGWIEKQLATKPAEAPVQARYVSPDGQTKVTVYDVPLGQEEDTWFLSRWENEGEKHSIIFWSREMYEQLTEDYTPVEDES